MKSNTKKIISGNLVAESFLVTFIILVINFILMGIAPFGNNSLACADAEIQYLDFFAYFKDCFNGKNSLFYSFSKVLGGNTIALFSYYLASPFNILLAFFNVEDIHAFFTITVALKLATAASCLSFFLNNRFGIDIETSSFKKAVTILLSVSYALSQYCLSQSSNIMWLDGVYMLPLILLGVYRLVRGGNFVLLSVSICLSVLFNWYTAGINCIFAAIWFVFELVIYYSSGTSSKVNIHDIISICMRFAGASLLGVGLSAILFFPTVIEMRNSSEGSLSFGMLRDLSFFGQLPSLLHRYSIGSTSDFGDVSLWCGSIPLLGGIMCFKKTHFFKKSVFEKTAFALLAFFAALMFCWSPLYTLFSLFKSATSYYYRYSYLGIFILIFMSADYFLTESRIDAVEIRNTALAFSGLLLLVEYLNCTNDLKLTLVSAVMTVLTAFVFSLYESAPSERLRLTIAVLAAFSIAELVYGTRQQLRNYITDDAQSYGIYYDGTQEQLDSIFSADAGYYRISQTKTRGHYPNGLTARYNDGLANNYMPITGYSSSPDSVSSELLERLGYRDEAGDMNIVNTSIISSDSFLGVKYVLSPYLINGYIPVDIKDFDDKSVFLNPYCFPLAYFIPSEETDIEYTGNPFEYQNSIFNTVSGKHADVMIPLSYSVEMFTDEEGSEITLFNVDLLDGDYAFYADFPWNSSCNAEVYVDDVFISSYSCWLSPSVLYLPSVPGADEIKVSVVTKERYDFSEEGVQIYALDLNALKECSDLVQKNAPTVKDLSNGHVSIESNSDKPEKLIVSVPFDEGWSVSVNGTPAETEMFADCFYAIELPAGNNSIEMNYSLPGVGAGLATSLLSLFFLLAVLIYEKKHREPVSKP